MANTFTRRPHFDAGQTLAWCHDADPVAMVHAAEEDLERARRSQEGGRWIPPTGLPPQAE